MVTGDTPHHVQELFRNMVMRRSGAERLAMGCAMFDASRVMLKANLKAQGRREVDQKIDLFLRTYAGDFDSDAQRRIVMWLSDPLRHQQRIDAKGLV